MARQIAVGIDIGTSEIKVIVTEAVVENSHTVPKIIGTGQAESRGLSRGYINDGSEAAKAVQAAVSKAEKSCGFKIRRAYVSFGGVGLGSVVSNGTVAISRADLEVTERDLAQVLESAEAAIPQALTINRRIINTVPIEYKIDGKTVWGQALGLKAQKLEAKALFITCHEQHLNDLIAAVEEAGVEVIDVVATPVALSFVTLNKKQKRVGCLLADIGAETLSIVVYENNTLVSLEVFPIGANDITNDIALGLKVSLEEAEEIKLGNDRRLTYSKKRLDEIVSARLKDYFDIIGRHLKGINRHALLPAGIILAGGGSHMSGVKNIAETVLRLPAQIAEVTFGPQDKTRVKDRSWAVACGLSLVGLNSDNEQGSIGVRNGSLISEDSKRWGRMIVRWFSQFLP